MDVKTPDYYTIKWFYSLLVRHNNVQYTYDWNRQYEACKALFV